MTEENINYFPEFNDDCYAECEEHFTVIRRGLLELEKAIGKEKLDKALLDELFRSFHTLKGLTGMIGQRDAEMLSHVLENFLRELTKNNIQLSELVLNGFFEGVKMLENLIDSLKNNKELPNLKPLIKQLNKPNTSRTKEKTSVESKKESMGAIESKLSASDITSNLQLSSQQNAFRIIFTPTPELFDKGINVNTIRKKMEALGEIVHSAPIVPEEGRVAFEFLLKTSSSIGDLTSAFDGIARVEKHLIAKVEEDGTEPFEAQNTSSSADRTFSLTNMVRVDLTRLDELMKMIGDLVISRARLDDLLKGLEKDLPVQKYRLIQETATNFERQLRAMREGVMRVRLIPIGEIFERMQFVIRDMIKLSKKQINLQISGKDTEIDKIVVEKMLDPLLHLVRNAVSHGIEMPNERMAKGKPAEGHISLNAYTSGDSVVIELQDDGCGIDKIRILKKAVELGLIIPQDNLTDAEILEIICAQGFSTREEADMDSGRGVGMAVVKKVIQELGGYLELDTEAGMGTKFSIYLPLTLAILDALILTAGGQKFAMPQPMVAEVLMIEKDVITHIENNELIPYRNGVLPIIRLSEFFKLTDTSNGKTHVLVIGSGTKAVGIMVDKVLSLREIVVRSLADPFVQVAGVSGATELGDGKALLILDTPSLIKAVTLKKNKIYSH
ncbi:MAG: chemotaxis protein CheA [Prolixibacteraceae bacterium]|nr:chemotaxis protein CheA [Prolixibacteraceae bacterium]